MSDTPAPTPTTNVPTKKWTAGRIAIYGVHWGIIINLAIQVFYSGYMVFTVLRPEGVSGPLWDAAIKLIAEQPDLMMTRRMYAAESWIAIVGLSLYVGITEILPRLKRYREEDALRG